ncbi:unnamed protein product [Phyllotreta striolata]|uniref:Transketolase-like pyrimidine-binding domain-containing protein n=1 Tax=Phyllotreta striolata TaxID=444603 RepID=A0A9N9TYS3_PHYSR|nr:unnamed protein product [Phyllotreta striolata]
MYKKSFKLCRLKEINSNLKRQYHSDNVFGFRSKKKKIYEESRESAEAKNKESNFFRLVTAYRQHGHKYSNINPVSLSAHSSSMPELLINRYGFSESDNVNFDGIIHASRKEGSIKDAVKFLNRVYCSSIGAEYLHLEDEEEIEWLSRQLEALPTEEIDDATKINIATELLKSQCFDRFLAKKFTSVKRYGGEGAESTMMFFGEIFKLSAKGNIEQIVLAMPHRGRLNLLTGMLNFPPAKIFSKLKGNADFPPYYKASGDVVSHFISSTDLTYDDQSVHVSLLYNPSHLEVVNPVSMGKTRAKQMILKDGDYGDKNWSDKVLNIQVHGDAAFAGQGVNQECLNLCKVPHFEVGGTIHMVVNNQVGFTTPGDRGRSSRYCTDLAKIIAVPVIHVNGDNPEEVLKATRLAFEYQRKFRKDVFVDVNCYRQWGHNELDDPSFTNPALYNIIRSKKTVPDSYVEKLVKENVMSNDDAEKIEQNHERWLNDELKASENYNPPDVYFKKQWDGFSQAGEVITTWDTGIDMDLMTFVGTKSVQVPKNFEIHPTLLKSHVKNRIHKISEGINIDWPTAETLAFGSLLFQGFNVRLSGQDVGRGTFSHRHAMLVDQKTNSTFIPLNHMHDKQSAFLEVANSILSEEAVLGFEYGMSVEDPRNLIVWEAQFGDFFNGAQIVFDTFVSSGESKWLWQSGLTVLLPHGYDGAGPDHSSSRVERFLQMTDSREDRVDSDDVNMQVCQPSTPAQYFHLLRRQMVRNFRKPLIIVTPKILLRSPVCVSDFADMTPGTFFKPVLGDSMVVPSRVKKILITSGKHFYSLMEKRSSMGVTDTAIIRVESFCPFPVLELTKEISKYPEAKVIVWCQEEHRNMGAWSFIKPRFENLLKKQIHYSGRDTLGTPAVGIAKLHQKQAIDVVTKPFLIQTDQ